MANPTVSIIIITRNRPALLQHCLEHVLAQPYPHKEIIVVDSSSDDESEQVVAQYPEVLSVRLYGQHNNRPQAKNAGLAVSSGEIIAFVDDDTMVQPGWLDALLATAQMPPGVPVACVGVDNARNAAVLAARILSI